MPKTEVPKVTKLPKCDQKVTFGTNGTEHMDALHKNNTNNVITLLNRVILVGMLLISRYEINVTLVYLTSAKLRAFTNTQ